MGYKLGALSLRRLEGVDPRLVRVVRRAIEISTVDFSVLEGLRTLARQKQLYAQGRTAPGKIVTWTMNSRHLRNPVTGFGGAVDLVPFPLDWNDVRKFDAIGKAMRQASRELGIPVRWGYDWNGNAKLREKGEYDGPHFELAK